MQMKSNLTSFDHTNFLYFNNMPLFYPLKNKETMVIEFKHLNNEILIKNSINLKKTELYKNFIKTYLKKAFSEKFGSIDIDIMNFYNQRLKKDVSDRIDDEATNEVTELFNYFMEDSLENKTETEKEANRK